MPVFMYSIKATNSFRYDPDTFRAPYIDLHAKHIASLELETDKSFLLTS
jgi:hypothetical protein